MLESKTVLRRDVRAGDFYLGRGEFFGRKVLYSETDNVAGVNELYFRGGAAKSDADRPVQILRRLPDRKVEVLRRKLGI